MSDGISIRSRLEAMGEAKVRYALPHGLLLAAWALPAIEWLAELDAAKPTSQAEGKSDAA